MEKRKISKFTYSEIGNVVIIEKNDWDGVLKYLESCGIVITKKTGKEENEKNDIK